MPPKRIVITGAPGTGKTVVVNELENMGYYCFHEIIRDMTAKAKKEGGSQEQLTNPLVFVDNPMAFNQKLLDGRKAHFDASTELAESICFFDRGIPDVLAYMDYFKQNYPPSFKTACTENTYDKIFIMPPWKAIYTSDNERLESFEEAEELHHWLFTTYEKFGYSPVIVPKTSIAERASFILENSQV